MKRKFLVLFLCAAIVIGLTGCGKSKGISDIRDWKDQYFNYLSYMIEHNPIKVHKVGFIKSKVSEIPIMYVQEERTDESKDNKSLSYYYIKDGEVVFLHGSSSNDYDEVKYLYNTEKRQYDYYYISKWSNKCLYGVLEKYIQSWTEYENKDDFEDMTFETQDDGFIIVNNSNTKKHIDDVLIDPEVEDNMFEFVDDNESFRNKVDEIKEENQLVTEEVKEKVEKEEERIKTNPKTPKTDEKPSTTDSHTPTKTKDGITANGYTISYGTYKSNVSEYMGEFGGEYTIKPDGTFSYTNTWKDYDGNTSTNKATGTYEVKYANMKEMEEMDDDYKWVIVFTATSYSGKGRFEEPPIPNDKYFNVDAYDITGNNKFQASQYGNVWTLIK